LVQNTIFLAVWVFLAAQVRSYILFGGSIVMFCVYCALNIAILKVNSCEPTIDSILNGVPEEEREHEPRKMFWTAVLTSWVLPYNVWSNNVTIEELKKKLKLKKKISSKHFLFVSNATYAVAQMALLLIYTYGILPPHSLTNVENPLLTICHTGKYN
jgi:hypothetical protein